MAQMAFSYYVKAFIALGLLTIIGMNAAILPIAVIPFILLFYAVLPTIGLTYTISVKRIYKQFRFTPDGKFGSFNRKWLLRLCLIFVISMFSALVFLVNAPSWGLLEWLFIWGSAAAYFPVSWFVRRYLRKELMPRFINAASIRSSFVLVTIAACVIFIIVTANIPFETGEKLSEAIKSRTLYFQDSSLVLLADLDKLSTFLDSISAFAVAQAATAFFVAGLVFRLIAFVSMLFGFVGILGFCTLSAKESKSVFQLLPAFDDDERLDEKQPVLKRYIVVPLVLWLALTAGLYFAEIKTEDYLKENETTPISDFVDNQANMFISSIEWFESADTLEQEFEREKGKLVNRYESKLNNLLIDYYDSCTNDIDLYLDWYYGFEGQVANVFKIIPLAKDRAIDEFNTKVAQGEDSRINLSAFKHQYDNYRTQMNELITTYNQKLETLNSEYDELPLIPKISSKVGISANPDQTLSLWPTLNSDNDRDRQTIVENILPSSEDSADRENFKNKLVALVNDEKQKSLNALKRQFDLDPVLANAY